MTRVSSQHGEAYAMALVRRFVIPRLESQNVREHLSFCVMLCRVNDENAGDGCLVNECRAF